MTTSARGRQCVRTDVVIGPYEDKRSFSGAVTIPRGAQWCNDYRHTGHALSAGTARINDHLRKKSPGMQFRIPGLYIIIYIYFPINRSKNSSF